jgi:sugar phosphate isomerase/epimerase
MFTRREFVSLTGGSLLATALPSWADASPVVPQPGYQLMMMATNWGFAGSHADFCRKAKAAGYDGIEVWFPSEAKDREALLKAVQENGLQVGFLLGGSSPDPLKHLEEFRQSLDNAVLTKPVYINCHSGKDHFSFADNLKFMEYATSVGKQTRIPVYHETHRGRILYSAPIARSFMEKLPDLRLTLDVSHWCNVHESLLQDQAETMAMTISRTDHIHARVGHAEGPQVNDPRAPEWKSAMDAHLDWWDKIVANKKREGKLMTILTEFGPVDYMPALPYTRQPVSNQWEINAYMMNILRKRYA